MELQTPTEESTVRSVSAHLTEQLPALAPARIESTVRRLVGEWRARSRIKLFIGIIAERHARIELRELTASGVAS